MKNLCSRFFVSGRKSGICPPPTTGIQLYCQSHNCISVKNTNFNLRSVLISIIAVLSAAAPGSQTLESADVRFTPLNGISTCVRALEGNQPCPFHTAIALPSLASLCPAQFTPVHAYNLDFAHWVRNVLFPRLT